MRWRKQNLIRDLVSELIEALLDGDISCKNDKLALNFWCTEFLAVLKEGCAQVGFIGSMDCDKFYESGMEVS
jgi:hypothetical protein